MNSGNKGLQEWKKRSGFDATRFVGNII